MRSNSQQLRALIVEDDPHVRQLVQDVLTARGHDVLAFADAETALQAIDRDVFPLIVLDWHLPGMDGLELCRRIRSSAVGSSSIILVITGRNQPEDLAAVLEAGADDYLAKPFDLDILEVRLTIAERQVSALNERNWAQAALEHQALHDAATGLPNRTLLRDRLRQAILGAHRSGKPFALFVMDLDHFKEVNDTFGHQWGDALLQQVGPRLQQVLRSGDTIARLGGDEFAVLLPDTDDEGAVVAARKVLRALEQPFVVAGQSLGVGASIGIALYPEHGTDAETLLRRADVAMYVAKRQRHGHALYLPEHDRHSRHRLALLGDMRQAIERGELRLHYQPAVTLQDGRVAGVEALVRWQHPTHGLIPPDLYIPLTEQTGLIRPLSRWVLEEAVRQASDWSRRGVDLAISVNLSPRNLQDDSVVEQVGKLIADAQLPPNHLWVEVTESTLVANPAQAAELLGRLRDMGVGIAIDDFGTGYSSLSYIKRLPATLIKIDRSFVRDMAVDPSDFAIVRATIELGHELGLEVVAEGVEDQRTWELLSSLGCDGAQGYYVSPPLPAEEVEEWLQQSPWSAEARSEAHVEWFGTA